MHHGQALQPARFPQASGARLSRLLLHGRHAPRRIGLGIAHQERWRRGGKVFAYQTETGGDIATGVETAIPLDLLVAGSVTNAYKHIFEPGVAGLMSVSLRATDAGCELTETVFEYQPETSFIT